MIRNNDSSPEFTKGQVPAIDIIDEQGANKLVIASLESEELKERIITPENTTPGKGMLSLNGNILSGGSQKSDRSHTAQSRRSRGNTEMSNDSERSTKSARRRSPKSKQGAVN